MGNSPSLEKEYQRLIQGLLHSIGIPAKDKLLKELFSKVQKHCFCFRFQSEVQLNNEAWRKVVQTLLQAHQQGDTMPVSLWSLCSFISQALQLLETNSERDAGSADLATRDPLYEDVAEALSLPPPPDEGGGQQESGDEGSKVSSDSHSDIQKLTGLLTEFLQKLTLATNPPEPSPSAPFLPAFPISYFRAFSASRTPTFVPPPPPVPQVAGRSLLSLRTLHTILIIMMTFHHPPISFHLQLHTLRGLIFHFSLLLDNPSLPTLNILKEELR